MRRKSYGSRWSGVGRTATVLVVLTREIPAAVALGIILGPFLGGPFLPGPPACRLLLCVPVSEVKAEQSHGLLIGRNDIIAHH